MIKPIFSDDDFKELNTIELNDNQKKLIWKNINVGARKRNHFIYIKSSFIALSALLIVVILATNFLNGNLKMPQQGAEKKIQMNKNEKQEYLLTTSQKPEQIIRSSDSKSWELLERIHYDLGVIQKIEITNHQMKILISRINSFGSDDDPLGQVYNPDTKTREYIIKTSEEIQILHLKEKDKVLITVEHYANGQNEFYAAEVKAYMKKDGKYYDTKGQLANLRISSVVNIANGNLETPEKQPNDTSKNINLNNLNITLPANWSKRGNENEVFFDDENKQTVGGISLVGYYGDNKASLPNHSTILNTEDIDISLGKGKIFTLNRSNPAASNNNETWNEIHAIIPISNNNMAFDIWIKGEKATLLTLLSGIQFK